jgi:hypothetical protein
MPSCKGQLSWGGAGDRLKCARVWLSRIKEMQDALAKMGGCLQPGPNRAPHILLVGWVSLRRSGLTLPYMSWKLCGALLVLTSCHPRT